MYSILYHFSLKIFNMCMPIYLTTKVADTLDILYKIERLFMSITSLLLLLSKYIAFSLHKIVVPFHILIKIHRGICMITISLCMIVKNEEDNIGDCLASVLGIADEIIVVDTGSTDNTKNIVKKYTDHLYDFTWQDDFSAARNFSFSKATMDYCMWLDADDRIKQDAQARLLAWKKQTDGTVDVAMLPYASGFDEKGNVAFCYYRERLLKRDSGFMWKGRVHEAIEVYGKIEYLDICIEHHSKKRAYSKRNLNIYQAMYRKGEPFEARDSFYYARELYYHKQYENALDEFRDFLRRKDAFIENQAEACRIAAYCCYALDNEKEALHFLLKGLTVCVPSGELCCDIGKHFMDRKEWEQAIFWFEGALHAPMREQAGGFVQKENYGYIPCVQLSVCYERMGLREQALNYHNKAGIYKPYGTEYLKNQTYFYPANKE